MYGWWAQASTGSRRSHVLLGRDPALMQSTRRVKRIASVPILPEATRLNGPVPPATTRFALSTPFTAAAKRIEAERRIFPERPELMLNLAVAYAQTGRIADARTLYSEVLQRPVVAMDMPNGAVVSSHDVATRGLSRLTTTLATR